MSDRVIRIDEHTPTGQPKRAGEYDLPARPAERVALTFVNDGPQDAVVRFEAKLSERVDFEPVKAGEHLGVSVDYIGPATLTLSHPLEVFAQHMSDDPSVIVNLHGLDFEAKQDLPAGDP